METVFVTGGTGLVGSHIICQLLDRGDRVKALVRQGSDRSWFDRLARYTFKEAYETRVGNLTWCEGDVTDIVSLADHLEDCSKVYHAAALVSFSKKDKAQLLQINVEGTANVINACLSMNERPELCYISSTASIGGSPNVMVDESYPYSAENATSYYSYTKYLAELEAFRGREEGLNIAIINPCIVLGFGNWNKGPSKFFKNGKNGFPFYTTGSNAFVDARDVALACIELIEKKVFADRFLCTGSNQTYHQVFSAIASRFGSKLPRVKVNRWMAEVAWRLAGVLSFFTGDGLITKESSRAGMKNMKYSSARLVDTLEFRFTDFEKTIENTCDAYLSLVD
ncbi:MAG: NAD-dependent epimerase/dehydratase family protein [Bacteroidia bacterium]|nr:NAD-dependent epimerase/dehydratase family protein [Bacteroidia bacterium]